MSTQPKVQDIYPLTPAQEGILFHSLIAPGSGVYITQLRCGLGSTLQPAAWKAAWIKIFQRHGILRTAFIWKGKEKPLQVVCDGLELPWTQLDWSAWNEAEQLLRLSKFCREDRQAGFDFAKAPLMRCALICRGRAGWEFVWTHHHLLLDGWSVSLLLQEAVAFYRELTGADSLGAEPSPPLFRDYVRDVSRLAHHQTDSHWKEQFQSIPEAPRLPFLAGRASTGDDYLSVHHEMGAEATSRLTAFACQQRITLNSLVQAAWSLLLLRHAHTDSMIHGLTFSGRTDKPEYERMVGLLMNTLPLVARFRKEETVSAFLDRTHQQLLKLQEIQHTPLSLVQRWSGLAKGSPLFESLVAFENYPAEGFAHHDASLRFENLTVFEKTNYPLTLLVHPGPALKFTLNCNLLLEEDFLAALPRQLECALLAFVDNPGSRLGDLCLVPTAERAKLECAGIAADYPRHACAHYLVESQVDKTPEALAVEDGDRRLTYAELNQQANRLANYLQHHGAGADQPVAVCLERSVELCVAVLGILKAGSPYVPLDPAYPAKRLEYLLADASPKAIVTTRQLWTRLFPAGHAPANAGGTNPRLIFVEDISKGSRDSVNQPNPLRLVTPDHLAYILYTSGSTGHPKGVAMAHGALVNLLWWQNSQLLGKSAGRILQFAPSSFDVSFQEMFTAWTRGAALILVSEEIRRDPKELLNLIASRNVEALFMPYIALQQFCEAACSSELYPSSLRVVVTAGEALQITPAIRQFFRRLPDCELVNQYGPTETHVVTSYALAGPVEQWPLAPAIGRPIPNTSICLLDPNGSMSPANAIGEICVSGVALARGYWNRPDLTAEKFTPHPLRPAERIYRTGDLGRWLPDGNLEFLGRKDQQLKIRGYRVEPREIEAALQEHPAILHAAAMGVAGPGGGKRLALFYCTRAGHTATSAEVREFLAAQLPPFMVPAVLVPLPELPLTPNGKVDRQALAQHASLPAGGADETFQPPRNGQEAILARIWQEVLGLPRIGVHDNFFDLGGHSLLATQIAARAGKTLGVELPVRLLFENRTIAELSLAIDENRVSAPVIIPRRTGSPKSNPSQPRVHDLSEKEVDELLTGRESSRPPTAAASS